MICRIDSTSGSIQLGDVPFPDGPVFRARVPKADQHAIIGSAELAPTLVDATSEDVYVDFVRVMQTRLCNGRRIVWFDVRPASEVVSKANHIPPLSEQRPLHPSVDQDVPA